MFADDTSASYAANSVGELQDVINSDLKLSIAGLFSLIANKLSGLNIATWAYGKEKLEGRKEICPTFSNCTRLVKKIFRTNFPKLLSMGGGGRSDYEKF